MLQQTIQVGQKTNETLKQQTEQLATVDENLDLIESNLLRADKQIRIFLRRMATDKVILGLILLVVLAIIITIVVAVIKNKGSVSGVANSVFTPPDNGNSTNFLGF